MKGPHKKRRVVSFRLSVKGLEAEVREEDVRPGVEPEKHAVVDEDVVRDGAFRPGRDN